MDNRTRVTAKLIAKQLGLSIATVDRALNNRGNVKKETLQKIFKLAEELNYTPNRLASFLSKKKELTIGVVVPKYPTYFWKQIEVGLFKAYDELRDYGLHLEVVSLPEREIAATMKSMIDSGKFDGLAVKSGMDALVDIIDYGIERELPICTFNEDSPTSRRLFYVGSDLRRAGRLAAELVCKCIGLSGRAGLIIDPDHTYQNQQKIMGFREVLSEYEDVEIWGPLKMGKDDFGRALQGTRNDLDSVDGIYVGNAEVANVAKYLEAEKLNKKITLIGHDLNDDILHYLKQGTITATIGQDPVSQGYTTIKNLFDTLHGTRLAGTEFFTKLEIITKENVDYYL